MTKSTASPAGASGSRRRSLAGWVVALLLLPFLLGSDSCFVLKTPIGDPEQGWADPRLSGVWLSAREGSLDDNKPAKRPSDYSARIWVFEPYDSKTWLVTWAPFKDGGASEAPSSQASGPPSNEVQPSPAEMPASAGEKGPEPGPNDVLRIVESLGNERAQPQGSVVFKAWLVTLGGRRFLVMEPKAAPSTARGFRPDEWLVFRADLDGGRLKLSALDTRRDNLDKATTRAQAEAIIARHAADPKFAGLMFTLHPVPKAGYDAAANALGRAFSR